jgi:hypothetical protein
VSGRAKFPTAGTVVIASGKKTVTVTLAGVTTTDFVLATVQGSGAFYVKNASAGSGKFTININKAPTAPATVKVAYFRDQRVVGVVAVRAEYRTIPPPAQRLMSERAGSTVVEVAGSHSILRLEARSRSRTHQEGSFRGRPGALRSPHAECR